MYFVQTSSDGLLIGNNPNEILGTSHVHLPNGQVENLEDDLKTLHQGLYYADYLPAIEGIYVFHMVTFDEGYISHGSGATNVLVSRYQWNFCTNSRVKSNSRSDKNRTYSPKR